MKGNGHDTAPRIPIPGSAGAAVFSALQGLVMKPGPGTITISKKPVAGGGYVYEIARDQHAPRVLNNEQEHNHV